MVHSRPSTKLKKFVSNSVTSCISVSHVHTWDLLNKGARNKKKIIVCEHFHWLLLSIPLHFTSTCAEYSPPPIHYAVFIIARGNNKHWALWSQLSTHFTQTDALIIGIIQITGEHKLYSHSFFYEFCPWDRISNTVLKKVKICFLIVQD